MFTVVAAGVLMLLIDRCLNVALVVVVAFAGRCLLVFTTCVVGLTTEVVYLARPLLTTAVWH